MVVQDDKAIAIWGDVNHKVNVASGRKSLLSALYGIAVSEGRINLSSSLGDLGIDDKAPSLTAEEKTATVCDLIMSRSGVCHPAVYETRDIKKKRPPRGSHEPRVVLVLQQLGFQRRRIDLPATNGRRHFQEFREADR